METLTIFCLQMRQGNLVPLRVFVGRYEETWNFVLSSWVILGDFNILNVTFCIEK